MMYICIFIVVIGVIFLLLYLVHTLVDLKIIYFNQYRVNQFFLFPIWTIKSLIISKYANRLIQILYEYDSGQLNTLVYNIVEKALNDTDVKDYLDDYILESIEHEIY